MMMNMNISMVNTLQRPSVIQWVGKAFPGGNNQSQSCITEQYSFQISQETCRAHSRFQQDATQAVVKGTFAKKSSIYKRLPSSSKKVAKNKDGTYSCQFCSKTFPWLSHWQAHERTHTGERPFKCEICEKAFTRSDGLRSHRRTHVIKSSQFPQAAAKRGGTRDTILLCDQDKQNIKDEAHSVQDPTSTPAEARIFKCQFCRQTFLSLSGLTKHIQRHKDKKELKCQTCGLIFNRPSALEIHHRVHTGEKPYRCNVCTKAFSIYGNLKRHLLIHTGERPYTCSKCSRSFNNPSHLTRHVKRKH